MAENQLKISDLEREQVVNTLADAYARGRLTLPELEQRSELALTSRTRGQLDAVLVDLPQPAAAPAARPHRPARRGLHHAGPPRFHAWLATALICLVVWLATSVAAGTVLYFWPVWVIGPWGAAMLFSRGGCPLSVRGRVSQP